MGTGVISYDASLTYLPWKIVAGYTTDIARNHLYLCRYQPIYQNSWSEFQLIAGLDSYSRANGKSDLGGTISTYIKFKTNGKMTYGFRPFGYAYYSNPTDRHGLLFPSFFAGIKI